jgi:putative ABC transport system ATP-binding protein/lipoprotein-releasing system ATP-binding protein
MPETLVRAVSLSRSFSGGAARVLALADATFSIAAGDTISLAGPSGSGKTTLLHLVAGLDAPTSGSIEWPALGDRPSLRPGPVSMSFQGASLLPPLTVTENVALPMILAGAEQPEATAAAIRLLHTFEMDALADKLPEELSGGQSQRAGLARAFSGSPRLVLADEPTGQQDAETGARLLERTLSLAAAREIALVIATHDASVAQRLSSRWKMQDGALRTETRACSV